MPKIAILGGPGSGKTVFLSVLAQRYTERSEEGYFLEPVNRDAAVFTIRNWNLMNQQHEWPPATPPGVLHKFHWKLHTGKNAVYDFNALDFAGEVYLRTFSQEDFEQDDARELAEYVGNSDLIILLLNLGDVVDQIDPERVFDNTWGPKAAIDFLKKRNPKAQVGIIFTKIDRYRQVLSDNGSWSNVYKKYFPSMYATYPECKTFGVAAVDKVEVNMEHPEFTKPATNFKSEGLKDLISWITREEERRKSRKLLTKIIIIISIIVAMLILLIRMLNGN